jgi:hypothetical protein
MHGFRSTRRGFDGFVEMKSNFKFRVRKRKERELYKKAQKTKGDDS